MERTLPGHNKGVSPRFGPDCECAYEAQPPWSGFVRNFVDLETLKRVKLSVRRAELYPATHPMGGL